jgi:hypothetical protein
MSGTLSNILYIGAGILITCFFFISVIFAWLRGGKYVYKQFEPPDLMPPVPTAEQLRESISKIPCAYDIVFDTLITTQFATGIYAYSWDKIYSDVVTHATAFAKDLDPSIRTLVVRAIRVDTAGKPAFAFEPIIPVTKN